MSQTTERRRKEDLLDSIYRASGNAIFIVDVSRDGEFVFQDLNPTHERITGMRAEWIRGRTLSDLVPDVPPEAVEAIRANYQRCVNAREPVTYQEMIPIKERETWWQTTLSPMFDDSDRVDRIVGSAVPIDNLKASEFALQAARDQLAADLSIEQHRREMVVEGTKTGIWEWNLEDGTVHFSDRWKMMLGFAPDEIEDDFQSWVDLLHPDDRDEAVSFVRRFVESPGDVMSLEFRLRTKNGGYRWIRALGIPEYDADGHLFRIIGSHKDISLEIESMRDLELRFQRFLSILDSYQGVVYVTDPETDEILYANKQTTQAFGHDLTGETCYKALQNRDSRCPFCTNDRIRGTRDPYTWEHHNPVIDRHYLITDQMIDWYDGREVRLEFALDISERKRMEDKLVQSNRDLQHFAYVASHDLQEPLRKIRAFGDRLRRAVDGQLNDRAQDSLQRMLGAAERMQKLIDAVLTFSRVHTRAGDMEEVSLDDVMGDVLSALQFNIEESGARVDVGSLPVVRADRNQMEQLFINLVGNAIKYRRPGIPPVVAVSSDRADGRDQVFVVDNGIGIDPEHREKVFGMFQRLHTREAYEGTGVGLAICRRIAERHGASITIESNEPKGSRFVVTFAQREPGEAP